MPENLSNHSKLLIISDTPMWKKHEAIYIFEPTLREIEFMTSVFDSITWIGFNYGFSPDANARITNNPKIQFILLPKATGGNRWYHKLRILLYLPRILFVVSKHLKQSEIVHTRAPSIPALIAILISLVDKQRKYWHKYAGNWRHLNPPPAYWLQRRLLKGISQFVSVNGRNHDDGIHIHSFENPCFSDKELQAANQQSKSKSFEGKLDLLFVGRIEFEKGTLSLLQAYKQVNHLFTLTLVGNGKDMAIIQNFVKENNLDVKMPGYLSRSETNDLYASSHLLILPTTSEGFPKVISEAAGFGCIPVVTSISVIGEYIKQGKNGFILESERSDSILKILLTLPLPERLKDISNEASKMASLFTYEKYAERIKNEFLLDSI